MSDYIGGSKDPKIKLENPWAGEAYIEVDYSAQQLLDQYPLFVSNQRGSSQS
jgi:hypothetical protein